MEKTYTIFVKDILEHKSQIPNFHDAIKLHQLLDAVRTSAEAREKNNLNKCLIILKTVFNIL